MNLGLGLFPICRVGGVVDPATLALTGWWRGSFSASPWTGTASAGSSGGIQLTEATNPPASGTAVNGFNPADFDGTNDRIGNAINTMSSYLSASAYYTAALVNADTTAAPGATFSDDELIIGESQGGWGISFSSSGVRAGHHTGSFLATPWAAMATGGWHFVEAWYDGTDVKITVDGAGTQTLSSPGNLSAAILTGGTPKIGANWANAAFYDGRVLEWMMMASVPSAGTRAGLKAYVNARYGLAL